MDGGRDGVPLLQLMQVRLQHMQAAMQGCVGSAGAGKADS